MGERGSGGRQGVKGAAEGRRGGGNARGWCGQLDGDGGGGWRRESLGDGARLAGYFLDWSDLPQYICGGKHTDNTVAPLLLRRISLNAVKFSP